MITLKQAIKVLGLDDDEMVFLCHEHSESGVTSMSVKDIREKCDMKNTKIERIYAYHFRYSDNMDWELIIKE